MKRILNWIRSHRKPKVVIITDREEWLKLIDF